MEFKYYILYKPFNILSQFSDEGNKSGLGSILDVERDVYPIGRLDADSEGLLLLTNDRKVNKALLDPNHGHHREYWVQVEGDINKEALLQLEKPMTIKAKKKSYITRPCISKRLDFEPDLPERNPPVRYRKNIPSSWISLKLTEGKNRQVRKMTAAVGFPTLRLVRVAIEGIEIDQMQSGEIKEISRDDFYKKLKL